MGSLEGKVAFITGVARGQGRSHALELAERGADIIGVDICANIDSLNYDLATQSDLDETAKIIEKTGRRAYLRRADVRDLDGLQSVLQEGVSELGRLDIVVANAGIFSMGPSTEIGEQTWQDMLDVNLTGVWHTVKAAVPHVRSHGRGGSIILTSSVCGIVAPPGLIHYNAAKFGVVGVMKTLAAELGSEYIRVNSVNPGNVDTPMIDNEFTRKQFLPDIEHPTREDAQKPGSRYITVNSIPVPWVDPQDVSEVVAFLASDEARYITGIVVPIDAGLLVKQ
ncbi:3-ketoacyl-ACP reductase [Rhodococcus sp. SC4]|nr:3-ketoacyl-ACP reductase [Rhodococcus sp. SC4]